MDNSLSKDYLHGLIDEGTVAEIDKPEEEPVYIVKIQPVMAKKIEKMAKITCCTWSSPGQPRS